MSGTRRTGTATNYGRIENREAAERNYFKENFDQVVSLSRRADAFRKYASKNSGSNDFISEIPELRIALKVLEKELYKQTRSEQLSHMHCLVFLHFIEFIEDSLNVTEEFFSMSEKNTHRQKVLEARGGDKDTDSPPQVYNVEQPAEPELRSFAERLEHYRKAAGLSQRALSAKAGLEQSHVSQLERSLAEPRLHTLLNLADALGIDPCALIPKGRGRG